MMAGVTISLALWLATQPHGWTDTLILVHEGEGAGDAVDLSNGFLAIGDVNADGQIELVHAPFGSAIRICRWNTEDDTFLILTEFSDPQEYRDLDHRYAMVAGDANNNGVDEILVSVSTQSDSGPGGIQFGSSLVSLEWNGQTYVKSVFASEEVHAYEVLAIGDITNNGANELVTHRVTHREEETDTGNIEIWNFGGTGPSRLSESLNHVNLTGLVVADMDGDAKNELVVIEEEADSEDVYLMVNRYIYGEQGQSLVKTGGVKYADGGHPKLVGKRDGSEQVDAKVFIDNMHVIDKAVVDEQGFSVVKDWFEPPALIRSMVIGDVDNDGAREVIVSGFGEPKTGKWKLFIYEFSL